MPLTRRTLMIAAPVGAGLAWFGLDGEGLEALDAPGLSGVLDASGAPVKGVRHADLMGSVTLLHAIASWCPYCNEESAFIRTLSGDPRFRLVGLFVRDREEKARGYMNRQGNPYAAVGFDADGKAATQVGVRGVPNSFVIDARGRIVHTRRGVLTEEYFRDAMLPAIEKAARAA